MKSGWGSLLGGGLQRVSFSTRTPTLLALKSVGTPTTSSSDSGAAVSSSRDVVVVSDTPMGLDNYDSAARIWNSVDNWCTLCTEPHNGWNEHRGKREHICLEMVYDLIARSFRPWDPHSCVEGTTTHFGHLRGDSKRSRRKAKEADAPVRKALWGRASKTPPSAQKPFKSFFEGVDEDLLYCYHSNDFPNAFRDTRDGEYGVNIFSMLRQHDRMQVQRRREIHSVMRYLFSRNLLFCGRRFSSSPFASMNVDFHGYLVLCKELFQPLINIFPKSDAKETSAMTQMMSEWCSPPISKNNRSLTFCSFQRYTRYSPTPWQPQWGRR